MSEWAKAPQASRGHAMDIIESVGDEEVAAMSLRPCLRCDCIDKHGPGSVRASGQACYSSAHLARQILKMVGGHLPKNLG